MSISVTIPIEKALERTKRVLFEDFNLAKWFTLGFCAWLASLGESFGGGIGNNFSGDGLSREGIRWVENNGETIVLVGIGISIAAGLLIVVLSWLRSRGTFMFLDGIVHDRGAVKQPWREFGSRGNRLFLANAIVGIGSFIFIVAPLVIGFMIAWSDIRQQQFEGPALIGTLVAIIGVLIPSIVFGLVAWLLRNFVAPTMYLHDLSVMEAWRRVKAEVITGNLGAVALFLLMRIALAFVIGCIAVAAVCLTCLLTTIPYIGTVVLLPLFVFERSYGLYFLEQFGPEWHFFPTAEVVAEVVEPEQ